RVAPRAARHFASACNARSVAFAARGGHDMARNERLLEAATIAYERGRLLHAVRTALPAVPMVLVSFGGFGRPSASIAIGAVLFAMATFVAWRGGPAARAVTPGLLAGVAPLVVPLVGCRLLVDAHAPRIALVLACFAGGLVSGAIVTTFAARRKGGR